MLSHHPHTAQNAEIRDVQLSLDVANDNVQVSGSDPDLRISPDYIDYLLGKSDYSLAVRFLFPATVDGDLVCLQAVAGDSLGAITDNSVTLPFGAAVDVELHLEPAAPAKKPKIPVPFTIRVRPKGGG